MTSTRWLPFLLALTVAFALVHYISAALGWPSAVLRFFFDLDREGTLQAWASSILWFLCAQICDDCGRMEKRNPQRSSWKVLAVLFLIGSVDEAAQVHEHVGHWLLRTLSNETFRTYAHSKWVFGLAPVIFIICVLFYRMFVVCFKERSRTLRIVGTGFTVLLLGAVAVEFVVARDERTTDALMTLSIVIEESLEMLGIIIVLIGLQEHRRYVKSVVSRDLWEGT